jgi:hypothetical protein
MEETMKKILLGFLLFAISSSIVYIRYVDINNQSALIESNRDSLQNEIDNLKEQIEDLEELMLQNKESLDAYLAALEAQIEALENQIDGVSTDLNTQVASLEEQIEVLEGQISAILMWQDRYDDYTENELKVVLDTLEAWQLEHELFHDEELTDFLNNLKAWQDNYQPYDDTWIYEWIANYEDMTETYQNIKLYFNIDPEPITPENLRVPLTGESDTSFEVVDEDNSNKVMTYSYNLAGNLKFQEIKEYYDNGNLKYSYRMDFATYNNTTRLSSESIYFRYNNEVPYVTILKGYNSYNGSWENLNIFTYDMSGNQTLSFIRNLSTINLYNNSDYSNINVWDILNHYISTGQILQGE